ncbi:Uncharacterised protein [Chlamydia trachomatis]|nr:Uncharacterised protein [Chlamydia trachomatis]
MNTRSIWVISLAVLVCGVLTRPHSMMGSIGIFCAGTAIAGLAVIEIVKAVKQ